MAGRFAEVRRSFRVDRDQFAELRKKNNLALSVNYLLFNGIVGDVDDKDVLVVDKWGAVTRAN